MALWVVLVSILARWMRLPGLQRIASFRLRTPSVARSDERIRELGRAIDGVLGLDLLVFRRRCWKRAIVLHRFLALEGISSRIVFGLGRAVDGAVRGHAWLERDGQPLLEPDPGCYTVIFSLPASHRAVPPLTGANETFRP